MKKRVVCTIVGLYLFSVASLLRAEFKPLIMLIDSDKEVLQYDLGGATCLTNTDAWGPVTAVLTMALVQKVAPIIVSGSVWRNFIERRKLFVDVTTGNPNTYAYYQQRYSCFKDQNQFNHLQQQLLATMVKPATPQAEHVALQLLGFYVPGTVPFNSTEWTMKKLTPSGSLLLLIPKTNDNRFARGFQLQAFSDVANMLDVDAFPKGGADQKEKVETKTATPKGWSMLIESKNKVDIDIIPTLKKLFVLNQENVAPQYEWLIYLSGHGSEPAQEGTLQVAFIAGLQEKTFAKLLKFFNDKITTKFLFYVSCYSGGQHLLTPYEQTEHFPAVKKGGPTREATRAEIFNYIIGAANVFQRVTATSTIVPHIAHNGIILQYPLQFGPFFNQLEQYFKAGLKAEPLDTILRYVHLYFGGIPGERDYLAEPLDAFLGNTKTAVYKTALYYDPFKKQFYIKKGQQNIYKDPYAGLYVDKRDVYLDPSKGPFFGTHILGNNDTIFLDQQQLSTGNTTHLLIEKGTGAVYRDKQDNRYYFTWESPKISRLQIPAIRFPGTGWFSTLDLNEKLQRVTRVQALTAQAEHKPIVTEGKDVVLFDTQSPIIRRKYEIEEHAAVDTFEIKKQGKKEIPQIMLVAPKDAQLYFEKIITDYGLLDIVHAFIPLQEYVYARTIYIKKLEYVHQGKKAHLDDVIILSSAPLPGAVGSNLPRYNGILYTDRGHQFAGYWPIADRASYMMLQDKKAIANLTKAPYQFTYAYGQDLTEASEIAQLAKVLEQKQKKGPLKETTPQPQPTPGQPLTPQKPGAKPLPQKPATKPTTVLPQPPQKSITPPTPQDPLAQKLQELTTALQKLRNALTGI